MIFYACLCKGLGFCPSQGVSRSGQNIYIGAVISSGLTKKERSERSSETGLKGPSVVGCFVSMERAQWRVPLLPMSPTVRLQPVYSWKGVLKLFTCIAARTTSKPKGKTSPPHTYWLQSLPLRHTARMECCRFTCLTPSQHPRLGFSVHVNREKTISRALSSLTSDWFPWLLRGVCALTERCFWGQKGKFSV